MRILFLLLTLIATSQANAASDTSILFEGVYGMSSLSPSALNTAREHFEWNNTTPTKGKFNNLTSTAFGLGYRVFDWGFVMLRYEQSSQTLEKTAIPSTSYSITDSFVYEPLYVLLDVPFEISGDSWMGSFRAGVGYAMKYEFHQKNEGGNGEDVIWKANPIGFRLGGTAAYMFGKNFGLFADLFYEKVSASLKAASGYQTTIGGIPIASGQSFLDVNDGKSAEVDMSGIHYGLGFRLSF